MIIDIFTEENEATIQVEATLEPDFEVTKERTIYFLKNCNN